MDRVIGAPGATRRESGFARLRPDQFRDLRPCRLAHALELGAELVGARQIAPPLREG